MPVIKSHSSLQTLISRRYKMFDLYISVPFNLIYRRLCWEKESRLSHVFEGSDTCVAGAALDE